MYCPACLPNGPKPAGINPDTGQVYDSSERYNCPAHHQTANLRPKGNGGYECHCGWKSESRAPVTKEAFDKLAAQVAALEAKLGTVT